MNNPLWEKIDDPLHHDLSEPGSLILILILIIRKERTLFVEDVYTVRNSSHSASLLFLLFVIFDFVRSMAAHTV